MQASGVVRMLFINALASGGHQLGLHGLIVAAEFTFEGEEVKAEHVEGRHASGEEAHDPEQWEGLKSLTEDFVLAPEASQGRDSTDRDAAN